MHVQILNPSPFSALRVFTQKRAPAVTVNAPAAAPLPKRETRDEILARGVKMTTKECRGTVNEGGVLRSVVREVPMPAWQAGGWESLSQFITETQERQQREYEHAMAVAAMTVTRGQRVVDAWGEPKAFATIAPRATNAKVDDPNGKMNLPLTEDTRYLIECPDDEAPLQIQNETSTRTLRLRQRDTKTGETINVAFAAPAQVALVIANGSKSAVVELTHA